MATYDSDSDVIILDSDEEKEHQDDLIDAFYSDDQHISFASSDGNECSIEEASSSCNFNETFKHFKIWVQTNQDSKHEIKVTFNMTVKMLTWKIYEVTQIKTTSQRLFYQGTLLDEPDYYLCYYGITANSALTSENNSHIIKMNAIYDGVIQTYFLNVTYFDPRWHIDFRNIYSDYYQRKRGGHSYTRPWKCIRYGVKVLGKYEDDKWLGLKGVATPDEWAVAYHGTLEINVLDILEQGFLLSKGKRFAYGKGIYCSPFPHVALEYGQHYQFNDKNYKLIIQCRVNPQKIKSHVEDTYWVIEEEKDIRPYAVCAYEM